MRLLSVFLVSITTILWMQSCGNSGGGSSNKLIEETSPYLLEHANNPVYWYPWGEEAFNRAKKEDKLMIISIGYSACHWCHVMERESFQDSTVAQVMNDNFISVKIDREERPDLDMFYVEAANLMTGRAGWPLNIIALSDGTPIYSGTYYPKDSWVQLLKEMSDFYSRQPDRLKKQGASFIENFKLISSKIQSNKELLLDSNELNRLLSLWNQRMDRNKGGKKGSPKFPLPASLEVFMKYGFLSRDTVITSIVETTLNEMIKGGIYDHLGGGFARYSTDSQWKVPHFEKMLYDNAQLISLYSNGYKLFKNPEYKRVVYETIEFMDRELSKSDIPLYYSSIDADSEEEEGTYYVWSFEELSDELDSAELQLTIDYFNIEREGNWEESKNVLFVAEEIEIEEEQLNDLKRKLFKIRERKERPSLDNKKLLSWNSLAVSGLVEAYKAFNDMELKRKAVEIITFLKTNYYDEKFDLYYHLDNKEIVAFLDDLSYYSRALIDMYEITYDIDYLNQSLRVTEHILENYDSDSSSLFHYNHKDYPSVSVNMTPVNDGVEPSSNGIMAQNLTILGNYFYDEKEEYIERSKLMSKSVNGQLQRFPMYYYTWFDLSGSYLFPEYEVAIVGDDHSFISDEIFQYYIPNALFLGGVSDEELTLLANKKVEGETFIYVCEQKSCKLPVKSVKEALELIN